MTKIMTVPVNIYHKQTILHTYELNEVAMEVYR